MVKDFSIDWLARSHYDPPAAVESPDMGNVAQHFKRHLPCAAQPRPPTPDDKMHPRTKQDSVKNKKPEATKKTDTQEDSPAVASSLRCSSPSFSEHSGYSSGYESEVALSEGLTDGQRTGAKADGARRRVRTKFTSGQIVKLENTFGKHRYLDAAGRIRLAAKLSLSETQVRTWFQNRRMKLKREAHDLRPEYWAPNFSAALFNASHTVQHHTVGQHLLLNPPAYGLQGPTMPHVLLDHMVNRQSAYPPMMPSSY